MDFGHTPDQEELRQVVRRFLEDRSPETEVRRLMTSADGYDRAVWKQMAEQLGLQALAVPEELSGAGFGLQEVGVVLEEMGRVLLCAPYFSTVALAATALLHSGDHRAQRELLPRIASGDLLATVAHTERNGLWAAEPATQAVSTPAGWRLTGSKLFVLDGHVADVLVVSARTSAGISLFLVDADAPGLSRTAASTLDLTRKQSHLDLCDTPARLLGEDGAGAGTLTNVGSAAVACLAMEQVGVAARALEMAVDYAKVRTQFGRPIGSFQAVKHKCADMLVRLESARSAAYYASWAAAHAPAELPVGASVAGAYCSDACFFVTAENVQIHGGIGFTWEHAAHLYFKRAKTSQLMFGTPTQHREAVARHLWH